MCTEVMVWVLFLSGLINGYHHFRAAFRLHIQDESEQIFRCGKLCGQVTRKVHMRWGGGRRQIGPVGMVHRKCVTDTK
jgi:hypothetical protein